MSHSDSGSASLPKAPQEGNNDSVAPTPNEILLRHYVSKPPPPGAMVRLRLGSAERRRPRPPHSPNTKLTTMTTHDHDQHRQQQQLLPASPLSTTPASPRAAMAGSFATAAIREMPPLSPQRPTTAPFASVLAAASPQAARPSTAGSPQGPVPVGRPSTAVSSRWSVASAVEASPSLPPGDRPSTARNSRHWHSAPRARDMTPTQLVSPGRQLCLSPTVHSARERRTVPPALLQKVQSMVVAPPPAPTRLQVDLQPFLAEDFSSLMATAPEAPPYHSVKSPQLHDSILAWNRSAMTLLRLP